MCTTTSWLWFLVLIDTCLHIFFLGYSVTFCHQGPWSNDRNGVLTWPSRPAGVSSWNSAGSLLAVLKQSAQWNLLLHYNCDTVTLDQVPPPSNLCPAPLSASPTLSLVSTGWDLMHLDIMSSNLIPITANNKASSFLWVRNISWCAHAMFSLSSSPIRGHLILCLGSCEQYIRRFLTCWFPFLQACSPRVVRSYTHSILWGTSIPFSITVIVFQYNLSMTFHLGMFLSGLGGNQGLLPTWFSAFRFAMWIPWSQKSTKALGARSQLLFTFWLCLQPAWHFKGHPVTDAISMSHIVLCGKTKYGGSHP